tara:strand:- start:54 stop:275 length:222 start_codon:yes stop_codon:yes gene_type:complete
MATTIKLKSSSSAGSAPTISNLSLRELAINTADGYVYLRKGNGSGSDTIQRIDSGAALPPAEDTSIVMAIALG